MLTVCKKSEGVQIYRLINLVWNLMNMTYQNFFIELQRMHHNISTNSITKNAYEKSEEQLKNHVKLPCFILAYTPRCSLKF